MGFFDFVANVGSSVIKVAATPLTIVADTVVVVAGGDSGITTGLIESAGKDLENSIDVLLD